MSTSAGAFCTSCGTRLGAGARFCTSCGAAVPASAASAALPPATGPYAAPAIAVPPPPWSPQAAQAGAAYPVPRRRESHWKRNFAVGVLVFLAAVLGLVFVATSGPVEAVERHLSLVARGDLRTAYAEATDGFKGQVTFERFAQLVEAYPILKKNSATWTSRSINGDEAVIEGTLTGPDGTTRSKAEYHLAKGADGTWRVMGFGVTPLSSTGGSPSAAAATAAAAAGATATGAAGSRAQLAFTATPARISSDVAMTFTAKIKNLGTIPIEYRDFKANAYAFELWQKVNVTGTLRWALEAQGYSYFRDLPDERPLTVQDFGTIRPGEEKEVGIIVQNLAVMDAQPSAGSGWTVLGKDPSGTLYAKRPGGRTYSCGTGIYQLELIRVTNLHPNARGLMIADVDPAPVLSNELDLGLTAACGGR